MHGQTDNDRHGERGGGGAQFAVDSRVAEGEEFAEGEG